MVQKENIKWIQKTKILIKIVRFFLFLICLADMPYGYFQPKWRGLAVSDYSKYVNHISPAPSPLPRESFRMEIKKVIVKCKV